MSPLAAWVGRGLEARQPCNRLGHSSAPAGPTCWAVDAQPSLWITTRRFQLLQVPYCSPLCCSPSKSLLLRFQLLFLPSLCL